MKKNIKKQPGNEDIHDNKKDKKYLRPENATLDLPEVKDIPGQEHIHPPDMKEFADVTVSSDDEEGKGLLDEENDDLDGNSNITREEKELLKRSAESMGTEDDENWKNSIPDNKDNDGEPLNEQADFSGKDLDVPGSELDDENEDIGEEDEENNSYSLGADGND